MKKMDSCRFCNIIMNYELNGSNNDLLQICDTVLYITDNFYVVPALGGLVPGYIMIISKKHINSMAYLSEEEMTELVKLVNHLKLILLRRFGVSPILFEHGSALGCSNKSACCVEHAHLHLVPVHLSREEEIIKKIKALKILDYPEIKSFKGEPYLLYINNGGNMYIAHNIILPSQYMRKWVAEEIGHPLEWDWRKYEFVENINKTIMALK